MLQKENGEILTQKVSRLARSAVFTDLNADQEYRIYTLTHAGQKDMPNDMQSEVLGCRTLQDNTIGPTKSNGGSDDTSSAISTTDIMIVVLLFIVCCL